LKRIKNKRQAERLWLKEKGGGSEMDFPLLKIVVPANREE
jgi:hypothetical protein